MRVIPPLTITNAMIVSSTIVELPPAAYAGGTTYAVNAKVSVGAVGQLLTIYESLQAGNVGHTPASSPTWWRNIGTTYALYSGSTTYAKGDRVIDLVSHSVFESQIASNTGQSLTLGTAWLLVEPTNYWAPFDRLRNTQAKAPVDIVYKIAPGMRTSSIAVIGLDARWITIEVEQGGALRYAVTVNLSKRNTRRWKAYFFGEFKYRKAVQFFNLPPYRDAVISITVGKASGTRAVGGIILGNSVYIGKVVQNPTSDHLNFSPVERDGFGNLTLTPRRSVPKVREEVVFDKAITSDVSELRETLNGVPAIWSALDDFTDGFFEPLFIYGIHKEFSFDMAGPLGRISLEVEEL